MALLGFLKQKKRSELELPPPPKAPEKNVSIEKISGIPDIRVGEQEKDEASPEFPSLPEQDSPVELPQVEEPEKNAEPVVFDKTIRVVEHVSKVVRKPVGVQKTFVSMDDYARMMQGADVIRDRLNEAESLVRRLNELRADENKAVDVWLGHLEDVEKKLAHIDKMLAKAQV